MTINLTIPDANAGDIVYGVCAATGWTDASGQTKAQWAKAKVAMGALIFPLGVTHVIGTGRARVFAGLDPSYGYVPVHDAKNSRTVNQAHAHPPSISHRLV